MGSFHGLWGGADRESSLATRRVPSRLGQEAGDHTPPSLAAFHSFNFPFFASSSMSLPPHMVGNREPHPPLECKWGYNRAWDGYHERPGLYQSHSEWYQMINLLASPVNNHHPRNICLEGHNTVYWAVLPTIQHHADMWGNKWKTAWVDSKPNYWVKRLSLAFFVGQKHGYLSVWDKKKRKIERKKTQFFSLIQLRQQSEVHVMALTVCASSGMFTFSSTSPFSFNHSGKHSHTHTQTLNTQTVKGAKGFTVQLSHCWSKHCSLTRHHQLLWSLPEGLFKTNCFLCPVFRSTISIYSDTRYHKDGQCVNAHRPLKCRLNLSLDIWEQH